MDIKKTGEFIAACRKEKGMTQKELADALGITNRAVSKWETGAGMPDIGILEDLSQALGVTIDELLKGEKNAESIAVPIVEEHAKVKEKRTFFKDIPRKQVLRAGICFLLASLSVAMQVVYLIFGKRHQLEYIFDAFPYLVNLFAIVMFLASVLFLIGEKQHIKKYALLTAIVLFLIDIGAWMTAEKMETSILKISPDFKRMMVLKRDEASGRVTIYKNQILWFARPSDQFPYTVEGELKTQWLANDICAVTYYSPDDGEIHQYVATYGDRGNGITTPYVTNMIAGNWSAENKNIAGWSIQNGIDGIVIINGSETYTYGYDDCVQFGTLAIALCENGLPQWTIALNEDCVEEDGTLTEGTITLCKVSLEKTAPMRFYGSGNRKYFDELAEPHVDEDAGKKLKKEMEKILQKDKTLTEFESTQDRVKIMTESTDVFWVSRLALEENIKQYAVNGISVDAQILDIRITAGDQYDFVVDMKVTEILTDANVENPEATETEMAYSFRIMKGERAYLASKLSYGMDGTVGLDAPGMEQERNTKNEEEYHFFVPGVKNEE